MKYTYFLYQMKNTKNNGENGFLTYNIKEPLEEVTFKDYKLVAFGEIEGKNWLNALDKIFLKYNTNENQKFRSMSISDVVYMPTTEECYYCDCVSFTTIDKAKFFESPDNEPCQCYRFYGEEGHCYGTKEMERCSCGANKKRCDFYSLTFSEDDDESNKDFEKKNKILVNIANNLNKEKTQINYIPFLKNDGSFSTLNLDSYSADDTFILGIKHTLTGFVKAYDFNQNRINLKEYNNPTLSANGRQIQYLLRINANGGIVSTMFDRSMINPMPELKNGMFVKVNNIADNYIPEAYLFGVVVDNSVIYSGEYGWDSVDTNNPDNIIKDIVAIWDKDIGGFVCCREDNKLWSKKEENK